MIYPAVTVNTLENKMLVAIEDNQPSGAMGI